MKLSIITITYNDKAGLEKTIASVMSQIWRDFEWIIIDGGSTDGSKDVIEELAKNPTANISYWCSEKDKGVYNAINIGIEKCNGEYLICMNGGDTFFDADTLSKFNEKSPSADIAFGDWMYDYGDHETENHFSYPVELMYFYYRNICHQAMFVKTNLLKKQGFDESYKLLADWARWVDAKKAGASFEYLGFFICHFEIGGMSNANPKQHSKEIQRLRNSMPEEITTPLKKLSKYQGNPYANISMHLTEKKGFASLITKVILRLLNKIF